MYLIAVLQLGTVFVLAAVFWARPIIEALRRDIGTLTRKRAAPTPGSYRVAP